MGWRGWSLPSAACGGAGQDPWWATLFLAAPAFVFALLIPVGRSLPGVGHGLRWFSLPLILLVPLAARSIATGMRRASVEGLPLCAASAGAGLQPAAWESFWAPIQLLVLAAIVAATWLSWRSLPTAAGAGK